MSKPLILDRISIDQGDRRLVDQISLTIAPGEVVSLMGPSGSGKSSLLAYLCGTLGPDFQASGSVCLGDTPLLPLPAEKRRLGILFQEPLLFPHLSVAENLAFALPPEIQGNDRRQKVLDALKEAELDNYGDRSPNKLSGGQQSRIALMRTLLAAPQALLLDEPFSRLDPGLRERFRRFVFSHARDQKLPVLMVTHDPQDAISAGGRTVTLNQTAV